MQKCPSSRQRKSASNWAIYIPPSHFPVSLAASVCPWEKILAHRCKQKPVNLCKCFLRRKGICFLMLPLCWRGRVENSVKYWLKCCQYKLCLSSYLYHDVCVTRWGLRHCQTEKVGPQPLAVPLPDCAPVCRTSFTWERSESLACLSYCYFHQFFNLLLNIHSLWL